MKYYVAADGGGTKLVAILYDDNGNILRTARAGGTNTNFRSEDTVRREMRELVNTLCEGVDAIEALDCCIVGSRTGSLFPKILSERVPVKCIAEHGEGEVPLFATGLSYGIVAQAGTGSDAIVRKKDGSAFARGGWGMLLGDEGGGYDIGLCALRAAIRADEGRAEPTVLVELIKEYFQIPRLFDLIDLMINESDVRGRVASVSRVCAAAARQGDRVARSIYEYAAHELFLCVKASIDALGKPYPWTVVCSGGAWKGTRYMYECFVREMAEFAPEIPVCFPIFEPLIGSVLGGYMRRGWKLEDAVSVLRTTMSEYLYEEPTA